jgi:hypothetical protein
MAQPITPDYGNFSFRPRWKIVENADEPVTVRRKIQ